jgi:hypothetical protein
MNLMLISLAEQEAQTIEREVKPLAALQPVTE